MSGEDNTVESPAGLWTRPRLLIGLGGLAGVALLTFLFWPSTKPSRPPWETGGDTGGTLEQARRELGKATDLDSCRSALREVNDYLRRDPKERPKPLAPKEREWLLARTDLGLQPDELAEVENDTFTLLDGQHLEFCFLLRDAARTYGLGRRDAADEAQQRDQAAAAFAWVMRQVRLQEASNEPLLPPHFVLRRGWGTSLERALVFLALLQQLGLDGCLIGNSDPDGSLFFWACGVLIGKDLLLFDARLGLPLPGPDGRGIATLAALRQQPQLLDQLTVDRELTYDVKAEQVGQARIYLACPLSAMAPRMQFLQEQLKLDVTLAAHPVQLFERFEAVARGPGDQKALPVQFWNYATRLLRSFLPADEGGIDLTNRRSSSLAALVPLALLPGQLLKLEGEVLQIREPGEPGLRMYTLFGEQFYDYLLLPRSNQVSLRAALLNDDPPPSARPQDQKELEAIKDKAKDVARSRDNLRELLLRGRFDDASRELNRRQEQVARRRQQMELYLEQAAKAAGTNPRRDGTPHPAVQQLLDWFDTQVIPAHRELGEIREQVEKGKARQRDLQDLQQAAGRVAQIWRQGGQTLALVLDAHAAELLGAEVTFQQGLCRHEQAEAAHAQADPKAAAAAAEAREAWTIARDQWLRYTTDYQSIRGPNERLVLRFFRMRGLDKAPYLLRARALEQLGQTDEAVASLIALRDELEAQDKKEGKDPTRFWVRMQAEQRLKQLKAVGRNP
jgi:hypothetical protein